MRSTTSCFNATLYRKTMCRFWPLWGLYALMWLFLVPLSFLSRYLDMARWDSLNNARDWLQNVAYDLPNYLSTGVGISCVFGVLCAMAVFGYLYSSRSACMMHALPLRREGLFATQYLAGLSFGLLPHLGVALLTLIMEVLLLPGDGLLRVLPSLGIWLAIQSATFLFFFSFAAFCAMFTGHILALPAFYAILNALVIVVWSLFNELMGLFFYGYVTGDMPDLVMICTPVARLMEACNWNGYDIYLVGAEQAGDLAADAAATVVWRLESPATVAAYAAAGLVFALLALMVYRYRHVESAGDVVAIALVRPVFKYGVALCAGLCFGTWMVAFFGWYEPLPLTISVLLWAAAGYFVAEMLLKKSFRVLRAWKGCAVTVALLALVCIGCFLDVFGVVDRVPDVEDVASVQVSGSLSYPYDSGSLGSVMITDPAQIGEITALHRSIVENRDTYSLNSSSYTPGDDYISLNVTYTLRGGATLSRKYYSVPIYRDDLEREGSITWCAAQLNADRDFVAACYNFDRYNVDFYEYEHEKGWRIWATLSNVEELVADEETGADYWSSMDLYLDGVVAEDKESLWKAIQADCEEGTIGERYLFEEDWYAHTYATEVSFSFEIPAGDKSGARSSAYFSISLTPEARHTLAWLEEWGEMLDWNFRLVSYDEGLSGDLPFTEELPSAGSAGTPDVFGAEELLQRG